MGQFHSAVFTLSHPVSPLCAWSCALSVSVTFSPYTESTALLGCVIFIDKKQQKIIKKINNKTSWCSRFCFLVMLKRRHRILGFMFLFVTLIPCLSPMLMTCITLQSLASQINVEIEIHKTVQILWKGCAATFMSTTVSRELNSGKGYILVLKSLHWLEWIRRLFL